ncbi:hypothetical protein BB934_28400 (plasmid) [Microvirga ossetica]|uniref:Resolvase HTH domain-containing protein n=1 Tax=Microvirga ossetica TaxID=1882682 RepID=A0A1B2EQJ9_9HYPH|nr:hypothetical protein BB934_28400 [Microvirga ossetica]
MLQAEEVAAMLRLHGLGWGAKRLAREFGCARNTVRRYLRQGGPVAFRKPVRRTAFDGLDEWLRERFLDLLRKTYRWRIRCCRFIRSWRADLQRSDTERRLSTPEAWQLPRQP